MDWFKQANKIVSVLLGTLFLFTVCAAEDVSDLDDELAGTRAGSNIESAAKNAINFDHELDSYLPQKDHYNFYFTYKFVHPWWDAVALGMEAAQRDFLEKGVKITYEYMAPEETSAEDQIQRLQRASQGCFDVLGVDVADRELISPVLDELIDAGKKVITFSSSDAAEGCKRIAYVGNTHNYEDGADLTEALCKKLGYKGRVALLVGVPGAPCHEERAAGAIDTIEKYKGIELVATEYDLDSEENAYRLTIEILEEYPDLSGIICCNMSNPAGAAEAVIEKGSHAVIAGMDHDLDSLYYLQRGVIYCLGVQDCYSIGYDTLQVAVKVADGNLPGELFQEKTDEITTVIYQEDAHIMLELLYGAIS